MKIFRVLLICFLSSLSCSVHTIRMRTACVLTALNSAASAAGSYYALQKCGVYLPDLSQEISTAFIAGGTAASTIPSSYWLYYKTPHGRLRHAGKDFAPVLSDPLLQSKSGEGALARMSRVYVNKDFPYIESLHVLQAHDVTLKKVNELLIKGRNDLKIDEFVLLEKYNQTMSEVEKTHGMVHDMIKAVRDLPDYTKTLKYFNELQAQTAQAKAQKEQAQAQRTIAWASWVSACAKVINAINPFKRG